jgi:hypothetical protein
MADQPRSPDTTDDTGKGPGRGPIIGTPRWVKVFGIIAAGLVVLVIIMLLTGHGPGRHTSGVPGYQAPLSAVAEQVVSLR